jgi:hypothetical protein
MRTIEQYDQLIDIQQRDLHLVKKTKNKETYIGNIIVFTFMIKK